MLEKIKKNWKIILIFILVLFGMNKCSVSCSRGHEINRQKTEIMQLDSTVKAQTDSIKYLNLELISEKSKGDAVNEAHNLGNDYYTYTINKLSEENKDKEKEILRLKKEKIELNKEINKLNVTISELKLKLENN
jgi:hypothetical protein